MFEPESESPVARAASIPRRFFAASWWRVALPALVVVLAFWRLGDATVFEWDEAQPGQIAFEMAKSGNWLRYTYEGQPEQAFARPPLVPWVIAASYRLVGFNEFGLRLPSLVAALLVVTLTYRVARLYATRSVAVLTCLIVISCRGLFGQHVGRTGDTDAALLAGEMGFTYFTLRYLDRNRGAADLVFAAISLAVAFWSKSIACLALPAGVALYALATRRLGATLRAPATWLAAGVFSVSLAAWFVVAPRLGPPHDGGRLPGPTLFSSALFHDAFSRTVTNVERHGDRWNPAFPWEALDSLWSPWFYVLCVVALAAAVAWLRRRSPSPVEAGLRQPHLGAAATWLALPLLVALVLMRSKLTWYAAPLLPPLSLLLAWVLDRWSARSAAWGWFTIAVLAFGFARQVERLNSPVHDEACLLVRAHRAEVAAAERVVLDDGLPQRVRLTLCFAGARVKVATDLAAIAKRSGSLVVGDDTFVGRFGPGETVAAAGGIEIRALR